MPAKEPKPLYHYGPPPGGTLDAPRPFSDSGMPSGILSRAASSQYNLVLYTHKHTRTHARTHTHTHANTHAYAYVRVLSRAPTSRHTCCVSMAWACVSRRPGSAAGTRIIRACHLEFAVWTCVAHTHTQTHSHAHKGLRPRLDGPEHRRRPALYTRARTHKNTHAHTHTLTSHLDGPQHRRHPTLRQVEGPLRKLLRLGRRERRCQVPRHPVLPALRFEG